jgi:uncharacterized protein YfaS (alpha-2-macroglobulin family)
MLSIRSNRALRGCLFILILCLLLAGCRRAPVTVTPTAVAVATQTAAPTPTATVTPRPTNTRRPTQTPTATIIPSPTPPRFEVRIEPVFENGHVYPNVPIVISFNQPMNPESSKPPLRVIPPIPGRISWDDTLTRLSFTPTNGFEPGTFFQIQLDGDLENGAGVPIPEAFIWNLSAYGLPAVHSYAPLHLAPTEQQPPIYVVFDRPMDQQTVIDALVVEPAVPFEVRWIDTAEANEPEEVAALWAGLPPTTVLVVEFSEPLDLEERYRLRIGPTAQDTAGMAMDDAFYAFLELPALTARVGNTQPITSSTPLTLTLNYPNLNSLLIGQSLRLEPEAEVNLTYREVAGNTLVIIRPETAWLADTLYSIQFSQALADRDGNRLGQPETIQFRTTGAIVAVYPPPGEFGSDGQSVGDRVEVSFDRPMDAESTMAAFKVQPAVSGEFAWEGNTMIFYPGNGQLTANTAYQFVVETTALDSEGQPILNRPYQWQVLVGELWTVADFGNGLKVQMVDANGRRVVHYRTSATDPVTATFSLYRLPVAEVPGDFISGQYTPLPPELAATWSVSTTAFAGTTDDPYRFLNPQEVRIPDEITPGAYVMEIAAGGYEDYLLLMVSHYRMLVYRAAAQTTIWVHPPTAGLEVVLYGDKGQVVAEGQTDAAGLFQVTTEQTPVVAVARQGDDMSLSGIGGGWDSRHPGPAQSPYLAYVYTDRPIYRPGHTVYFRAIVRDNNDASLQPPAEGTAITARIRDARDNVVQTFQLSTNHFGTVYGQFQLAEGAMLGEYRVEVAVGGGTPFQQGFKVEEYRRPDYEVTVSTEQEGYLEGEVVTVTVESHYYFGEPVANAEVIVQPFPGGWDYEWEDNVVVRGETDGNGRATLTFIAEPGWWLVEATVDDGSHQVVSNQTSITGYRRVEQLSLEHTGWGVQPGQSFTAQVTVLGVDGKPVSGRQVNVNLEYHDPAEGYRDIVTLERTTSNSGRAFFNLPTEEAGQYRLWAWFEDPYGNDVQQNSTFDVRSPEEVATTNQTNPTSFQPSIGISKDRSSYAPGQTARLQISSSFTGTALLTLYRADIRSEQLVYLNVPTTTVEIVIRPEDVPNIVANVHAWYSQETQVLTTTQESIADGQLLEAWVVIHTTLDHKVLEVEIRPDKSTYVPGETATIVLRATNYLGDPVSAELSLAMVDEGIFSLSPDLSAVMLDTFYYLRPSEVAVFHGLRPERTLWYTRPQEPGGMGGGGGDGGTEIGPPRRDFQDTAAWFPGLQTDSNGLVTVTVTLPDNLTSWRLTARAVTADTQVGQAVMNVTTHKPLIVRPLVPHILTAGDGLQLSAIVHNNSNRSLTVAVSLSETGGRLQIQGTLTQTITLTAGEVRVVGWPVTALSAGEARVLVQARGSTASDAVEVALPIRPLSVPTVTTMVGDTSEPFDFSVNMPADALEVSTVQVQLSRSIAGSMLDGLEYLTGYPYGCVEQTLSKGLPTAVVGRAFARLGVEGTMPAGELEAMINATVQRLYSFQHLDGGWGWWEDDASHDYQTAWVIFGLVVTAEAGYEIDQGVIERGAAWLQSHLHSMDARTRAFALYSLALAGSEDQPYAEELVAQVEGLDPFSQAALALALYEWGETAEARAVLDVLAETAVTGDEGMFWMTSQSDGIYNDKTMASAVRSTALALSAFVRISPNHPLEAGIVRWLMGQRQGEGWGTTNETAFTILALTDHLLAAAGASGGETAYMLEVNGQVVVSGTLSAGAPNTTLTLTAEQFRSGVNHLRLSADEPLYYVVSSRIYRPQASVAAAGPITVQRVYQNATTHQALTTVTAGQVVEVRITVQMPSAGSYMIVEDNLPGGLEALNDQLATTSVAAQGQTTYQTVGYNYKEIRDGRVSFFITDLPAGSHTFIYYARAVYSGEFVAMPAEVYAMYNGEKWGHSATSRLVIGE